MPSMRRIVNLFKGVGLVLALSLVMDLAPLFSVPSVSAAARPVLITGVQTGGATDASAEYVRVSSSGNANTDVSGWKLQYKAATGTTWTTKVTLQGLLGPGGTLLLATSTYPTGDPHLVMQSGMSAAGGHVQLVDVAGKQVDLLGWGSATSAQGTAASAPSPGQALERKQSGGSYLDTGNNAADFVLTGTAASPTGVGSETAKTLPADTVAGSPALSISELLPNPASPQTDSADEFVELYNPNAEPIDLNGYKLQTGSTLNHGYTFKAGDVVPAGGYHAFTSSQTKLSLSNTGGKARLLAPDGSVIDETLPYGTAADGQAWALFDDTWDWTTTPTPGAANHFTAPAKSSASSGTSSKTTAAKSSSSGKSTTIKTTTTTRKSGSGSAKTGTDTVGNQLASPSPIHPLVLAGVGGGALAYAGYEYRHDLFNRFDQLRRYLKHRRGARAKV